MVGEGVLILKGLGSRILDEFFLWVSPLHTLSFYFSMPFAPALTCSRAQYLHDAYPQLLISVNRPHHLSSLSSSSSSHPFNGLNTSGKRMGKSCYMISLPSHVLLHTDASCGDIKVGRKAYGQKDILSLQVEPWVAVTYSLSRARRALRSQRQ